MVMNKTRYQLFAENFGQDIGFFLFFLILLSVYRAGFLIEFKNLLAPDTSRADIWLTLWYGLRISLKTAGAAVLVPFVFGTVMQSIFLHYPAKKVRFYWGLLACTVFALLF
jgi:ABC-type dipeptide/oligopeptide/nickel transport system permease subunit